MGEFHEDKKKQKYEVMQNPDDPVKRDVSRVDYSKYEYILEFRTKKGQSVDEPSFFLRISSLIGKNSFWESLDKTEITVRLTFICVTLKK